MKKFIKFGFSCILVFMYTSQAIAALDVELTKGIDSAIPIAVVPFAWESKNAAPLTDVSKVISNDLRYSGQFSLLKPELITQQPSEVNKIKYRYWRGKNVDYMVIGKVIPLSSGDYKVRFALIDLFKHKDPDQQDIQPGTGKSSHVLINQEFVVPAKDLRRLSHHISDLIYEQLTGEKGVFSTRLAYVIVKQTEDQETQYQLEISDFDGMNSKPILRSDEPIMSPSWSPDGKYIAYVSFEGKRPQIYVSEVTTGKRELITSFPGINGAPTFSPDGKKLALALSAEGSNPNIYVYDLETNKLQQLTHDLAINTEPYWSPSGKEIIFTSDRGGTPQIYLVSMDTNKLNRVTYDGNYNSSAKFSPDGKSIVLLHRDDERLYNIALLDLQTGTIKELTRTGMNESPSISPNGRMIVYGKVIGGRGILGMVSADGRVKLRLPDQEGNVQEPVWSPYLDETVRSHL